MGIYFDKCIELMKKVFPSIVVLTPENIDTYVDDFPIRMHHTSKVPIRRRVDLLFAYVLEKHGGLCISPGTVIFNGSEAEKVVDRVKVNDLVTVGSSPSSISPLSGNEHPNTYIIGAKKGSLVMKTYKETLKDIHYRHSVQNSYDVLSSLIKDMKPVQYHLGSKYDGTYSRSMRPFRVKDYLSRFPLDYMSKDKKDLYFISIPYDRLLRQKDDRWFLYLSEEQLKHTNVEIIRRLQGSLTN